MNILVTGGAGFIGSHLCDRLVRDGHIVTIVDNLTSGSLNNINPGTKFYKVDLRSPALEYVFEQERPELVIHLAAQVGVGCSQQYCRLDADINILGSINLYTNTARYGCRKLIYASSAAVYGEPVYLGIDEEHPIAPLSFYGLSKYTAERYLTNYAAIYGFAYTILRYANVYGPRQSGEGEGGVVAVFIDRILNGVAPTINGNGEQTRDFVYVKDVVEANVSCIENANNKIVNVGTSAKYSIKQLYEKITRYSGSNITPCYGPWRKGDIVHSWFNNQKAYNYLKWRPVYSLDDGLIETIGTYRRINEPIATWKR